MDEEKKGKEKKDELENIIEQLDGLDKGYVLIVCDNTSGLIKDASPEQAIKMRTNLIDPLVASYTQKVVMELRQRGA